MGSFHSLFATSTTSETTTPVPALSVEPSLLTASKLGERSSPRWGLSTIKVADRETIVEKGVSPLDIVVKDIAEGHDASVVNFLAGEDTVKLFDSPSEEEHDLYVLSFPQIVDAVLSVTFPEGVHLSSFVVEGEDVNPTPLSGTLIEFRSAWGLLQNPKKKCIVTFRYSKELQASAPLSENIVFRGVCYSEDIRSSIHNFTVVSVSK